MPAKKNARRQKAKKAPRQRFVDPLTAQMTRLALTRPARKKVAGQSSKVSGGNDRLARIAKAITLPSEMGCIRFPSPNLGTDQTAVTHLTTTTGLDWLEYPAGTQCLMLTGSPFAPVWSVVDRNAATYVFDMAESTSGAGPWAAFLSSVVDVNSPPCYPARYNDMMWVYVPAGIALTVAVANYVGTGVVNVEWHAMNLVGEVRTGNQWAIATVGGAGSFTLSASADAVWYTVARTSCALGTTLTATATLTVAGGRGFWPKISCPALAAMASPAQNLRVNANAVLLTNTSKPLYTNGDVTAARLVSKDVNVFTPSVTKDKVASVNEALRYSGPAAKGVYSYYIPTDASQSFSDYVGVYTGTFNGAASHTPYVYDMMDFAHVNVIHFNVQANDGFNLKMRHDMHLEFRTDAEIFTLGVPMVNYSDFYAVVTACSKLVPFTENPVHIAQLGYLARKVLAYLGPILAPHAKAFIRAGAQRAVDWIDSHS